MNMINNYLSNFEDYLPDDIKQEVREELESSIYEQVEDKESELGRKLNDSEIELLLKNIGHPMRVAAAYLPTQQLVGKELFPAYKKSLEISLAIVSGIILLLSIPFAFSNGSFIAGAISIFAELINTGLYVFAIVTIVFYLMEYYQVDLNEIYAWSPKQLRSKTPNIKLSRLESGFELVFYILFLAWWNDFFDWPGTVYHEGITASISFSPEWQTVALAINIIIGLSVVVGFHKFVVASWTKFSLLSDIVLAIASLVVVYQIAQFDQYFIFNDEIANAEKWTIAINIMNNIIYSIIGITALVSIWEVYSNAKKLIRL